MFRTSSSCNLLSAARARSQEEPVIARVTPAPHPARYPLKRALSFSEFNHQDGPSRRASTYCPFYTPIYHTSYHRDWDLGNDYRHTDRAYDLSTTRDGRYSIGYPKYSRYHPDLGTTASPSSVRNRSTNIYESPKGTRSVDYFDSFYWRTRLDPYSAQAFPGRHYAPWSFRPRIYETMETSEAVRMYKKGLIGYETFAKYWIKPTGWYQNYLGKL